MSEYSLELIERNLKDKLINELNRSGLLFRIFSRIKNKSSIDEKFNRKTYSVGENLMQDLFGFRITTYFSDDVKIVADLCEKLFEKLEFIYDEPEIDVFKPLRKNMICKLPEDMLIIFDELKAKDYNFVLIDHTFEIQFRTTLSEGWHEVDHLMRYKCKSDWSSLNSESRMLNGIYATLETNDQTLKSLFDDISYQHYKTKNWEAMIRNKFRLRFLLQSLDLEIVDYLDGNHNIGKEIYKLNRQKILYTYMNSTLSFPITFNNLLYFINYYFIRDEFILGKTPEIFIQEFELSMPRN